MSSTIAIKLNFSGDVNDKNIGFFPYMIKRNIASRTLYFPTTFKITDKLIRKSVEETNDFLEIVTSRILFSKIIMKITKKRNYKALTLQEARETGIVKENMMFYKNKLFKNNSKIYLSGGAFDILASSLDENSIVIPTNRNNLVFKVNINIKVIGSKNNNYENRTALTCETKRNNLNKIFNELFGKDLFEYRNPIAKSLSQISPTMYSSVRTGETQGKRPYVSQSYPYQMNNSYRYSSSSNPQMQRQFSAFQPQMQRRVQPQFRSMQQQPQMQRRVQPQFRSMQQQPQMQRRVQQPISMPIGSSGTSLRSNSVGGKKKTRKRKKKNKKKTRKTKSKTKSKTRSKKNKVSLKRRAISNK